MNTNLKELIPFFSAADDSIIKEFNDNSVSQSFTKGTFISMEGDACQYFPIVKSGIIRVFKIGSQGQEMTLYRINSGESCILTISCLLSNKKFPAVAFAEQDSEVVLISASVLKDWIKRYEVWSEYVFDYLSKVLLNVLSLLENISFKRTDVRIMEYLVKHSLQKGKNLSITHQHIAQEIGTAREVVSRILKEYEKNDLIDLSRGKILIKNLPEIQKKLTYLQ